MISFLYDNVNQYGGARFYLDLSPTIVSGVSGGGAKVNFVVEVYSV